MKSKLESFFQKYTLLRFKKGEIVLKAGDVPVGIFYIKKGLIRQYTISQKGEVLVINIFRPGSFFMMMWALNNEPNTFYLDAVIPSELWRAPLASVRQFLKSEPEILFDFTTRILAGLSGLLKRLEYLVLDPASVKIALLLSYFAQKYGEKDGADIIIKLPLTHREIASWIGTTRETASLQLEDFKRRGIITTRGRVLIIKDLARLEKEASFESKNPSI